MIVSDVRDEATPTMDRLREKSRKSNRLSEQNMLFVWQEPIMSLAHSVIFYVVGLISAVIRPSANKVCWYDEAKVS